MSNVVKERLAEARAHRQRGEHAAAEQLLSDLAQAYPHFADVQNELGLFFHEAGDFDRAQFAFQKALAINPAYTEAALHLAITWNDLGRYEEARELYTRAVERTREGKPVVDPLAAGKIANMYAEIGDAFLSSGNAGRAVTAYREALDLRPTFHDIRLKLANSLQANGERESAVIELEFIVGANPEQFQARLSLGLAYLVAGEKERAIAQWREVLTRAPDHKRAQQYLRLAGAVP